MRAERHNELVDFIMYESEAFTTNKALEDEMCRRFGDFTMGDINKALEDAKAREEEIAQEKAAFYEAMRPFEPLFVDEAPDETFEAIATRKAIAGDALAIKFLATFPRGNGA